MDTSEQQTPLDSEGRYRSYLEHSPYGVFIATRKGATDM